MSELPDDQLEKLKQAAKDLASFENQPIEETQEQIVSAMRWEIDTFWPAMLSSLEAWFSKNGRN